MKPSVFKKYDIRGKVFQELMLEHMYDLGRALAVYIVSVFPAARRVVIGMDGRAHSAAIKESLTLALIDSGLDVIFLGECPTPVVYFAQQIVSADAGIMITASHNGPEYNGLKITINQESVWGKGIERIKHLFEDRAQITSACRGLYSDYDAHTLYLDWLVQHFSHLIGMSLPLVIDCGHGMAATIMPELIERFEWKHVELLYATVEPHFPQHLPDPTRVENMQELIKRVQSRGALAGIGFDGDADRMAVITHNGKLVSGDLMLALFAESIIHQHPHAAVVFDVKCSALLETLITGWGGRPCMTATGHSLVKAELKKQQALFAGELSGHFFFNDRYFGYDDGIYAALRLIELLLFTAKDVEELLVRWPSWYATPELRLEIESTQAQQLIEDLHDYYTKQGAAINTLDGIRVSLPYGTCIARHSHTEPVICVRWESETKAGFAQLSQEIESFLVRFCAQYKVVQQSSAEQGV